MKFWIKTTVILSFLKRFRHRSVRKLLMIVLSQTIQSDR